MYKQQNAFQIFHSRYATEALTLARKRGMTMKVVGQGDVPLEPFYRDEWWFEPMTAEFTIPAEGLRRTAVLKKAGIRIKGMVIAHEAPRLLPAPRTNPSGSERNPGVAGTQSGDIDVQGILTVLGQVLMTAFLVFGFVFVIAARLDPALIVVLEDDTWMEVLTWYE